MANVQASGNMTVSFSVAGTRNSDGSQEFSVPAVLTSLGLSITNFTLFDQGKQTVTQDDYDLTASNLDGTGSKDFTALYVLIILVPIAGSGSGTVTVSSGTTNPYLCAPLAASGMILTQSTPIRVLWGDRAVSSTLKTLDLTLSGTMSYWMYVLGGPSRF